MTGVRRIEQGFRRVTSKLDERSYAEKTKGLVKSRIVQVYGLGKTYINTIKDVVYLLSEIAFIGVVLQLRLRFWSPQVLAAGP